MAPAKPAYDAGKIEDAVMALLGAFEFDHGRVWKRYDFDVMDALHAKGLIPESVSPRVKVPHPAGAFDLR